LIVFIFSNNIFLQIRKLESEGSRSNDHHGTYASQQKVDAKAEAGLADMSNERRLVVEALTEERSR
jgi:hypothetical protein